jgi:hypothetical protein
MKDDKLLIHPEKLQALRKHLELRIGRRKKARELLLPEEKSNFINKMKNVFNTYQ